MLRRYLHFIAFFFSIGILAMSSACAEDQKKDVPSPPSSSYLPQPAPPDILPALPYMYWLEPAPLDILPIWADSNSPLFWDGDMVVLFISPGSGGTVRFVFDVEGTLQDMQNIVWLNPEEFRARWIEAVWNDEENDILYGWYHEEPPYEECGQGTAPKIGASISFDKGLTWHDKGIILESPYSSDCSYENGFFTGGNGDFSVLPDPQHQYFTFFFSNYGGPLGEQGIAVARSSFADRGQPGTVEKYYRGAWESPGVGGKVTPLFPATTSWKGPLTEAFWGPSVHWNTEIQHYVLVMNKTLGTNWSQEGIYIAFSEDAVHWSDPEKLIKVRGWYPEVIGLGEYETDRLLGAVGRLYVQRKSSLFIHFRKESP